MTKQTKNMENNANTARATSFYHMNTNRLVLLVKTT